MDYDSMTRDDVVTYVNDELVYKPGWTLLAEAVEELGVKLSVRFTAPNSNREEALAGYPVEAQVTPIPTHTMYLAAPTVNEGGVLDVVLIWLADIEIHEAREFLRVRSDNMAAPFHPHRWAGTLRMDQSRAQWPTAFPEPGGDLMAGLEEEAAWSRTGATLQDAYVAFLAESRQEEPIIMDGFPPELARLLGLG